MFKRLRSALKKRRREKDLARKLAALETRFPNYNWGPFQEVSRFFSDKSMSSLEEQAFLYRLATEAPPDATAVEIGSWIGHSTCILGAGLRGGKSRLIAIDAFSAMTTLPREKSYYQKFLRNVSSTASQRALFDAHIAHFGLQDRITALAANSAEAAAKLPGDLPPVDLLFIDGGHTLDTVREDIRLYVPRVRGGGVVVFHDFSSSCGVPQAVWEEVQRGTFRDLIGIHSALLAFRKA